MDHAPDFVKLAEAYGGPVLMDFHVEKEEGVYPMVPAGAPITEMLLV